MSSEAPTTPAQAGRLPHAASALSRSMDFHGQEWDVQGLNYLQGCSKAFIGIADVVLVAGDGRRLPVHSQILAQQCDVFAALFESVCSGRGGGVAPRPRRSRPRKEPQLSEAAQRTYAEVAAVAACDEPLVFKEAFAAYPVQDVDNFLTCVYAPHMVRRRCVEGKAAAASRNQGIGDFLGAPPRHRRSTQHKALSCGPAGAHGSQWQLT